MEWKLQYLFWYTIWTVKLISDPRGGSLRRLRVAFFTFRVVSRIHARLEVRPRPDVAFIFFVLCFVKTLAVLSLGLLCVRWHASDGENRELGTFVLFLVQYAVYKSLALQILPFLLISVVVKWVHCWFFSIKSLWTTKTSCAFFSVEHFSVLITSLFVAATSPERSSSSIYLFF